MTVTPVAGLGTSTVLKSNFVACPRVLSGPIRSNALSASSAGRRRLVVHAHKVEVEHQGKTHILEIPEDETILSAAIDAGLDLPHDCKLGVCMTCPAKLISVSVSATASPPLRIRCSVCPTPSPHLRLPLYLPLSLPLSVSSSPSPHSVPPSPSPPLHLPHFIFPTPSSPLHLPHSTFPTPSFPLRLPISATPSLSPPLRLPHSIFPISAPPLCLAHSVSPSLSRYPSSPLSLSLSVSRSPSLPLRLFLFDSPTASAHSVPPSLSPSLRHPLPAPVAPSSFPLSVFPFPLSPYSLLCVAPVPYVVYVYGNRRRLSFPDCYPPPFDLVDLRIRKALDIPFNKPLEILYDDTDGYTVPLSSDEDLYGAFVLQKKNLLDVTVAYKAGVTDPVNLTDSVNTDPVKAKSHVSCGSGASVSVGVSTPSEPLQPLSSSEAGAVAAATAFPSSSSTALAPSPASCSCQPSIYVIIAILNGSKWRVPILGCSPPPLDLVDLRIQKVCGIPADKPLGVSVGVSTPPEPLQPFSSSEAAAAATAALSSSSSAPAPSRSSALESTHLPPPPNSAAALAPAAAPPPMSRVPYVIKFNSKTGKRKWRISFLDCSPPPLDLVDFRIHKELDIPADKRLMFHYHDTAGDWIRIATSEDLYDVFVLQKRNLLEVTVEYYH
ncbi:unnamed protein product [Closterium sp. Naga37s-1]|nr:unnamed protein product [Closterium sp. Naga37s-1]